MTGRAHLHVYLTRLLGNAARVAQLETAMRMRGMALTGFRVLESLLQAPHSEVNWTDPLIDVLYLWGREVDLSTIAAILAEAGFTCYWESYLPMRTAVEELISSRVIEYTSVSHPATIRFLLNEASHNQLLPRLPISQLAFDWSWDGTIMNIHGGVFQNAQCPRTIVIRRHPAESRDLNWCSAWFRSVALYCSMLYKQGFSMTLSQYFTLLSVSHLSVEDSLTLFTDACSSFNGYLGPLEGAHAHLEMSPSGVMGVRIIWNGTSVRGTSIRVEEANVYVGLEHAPADSDSDSEAESLGDEKVEEFNRRQLERYHRTPLSALTEEPMDMRDVEVIYEPDSIGHTTCFNQLSVEDERVDEWLSDSNKDQILLLNPPDEESRWGTKALCYTRSWVQRQIDDPTARLIRCGPNSSHDLAQQAVKLPMGDVTMYVPLRDARYLIDAAHINVFQLRATAAVWDRTASLSYRAGLHNAAIGGNRCQVGTDIPLHRVRGVVTVARRRVAREEKER